MPFTGNSGRGENPGAHGGPQAERRELAVAEADVHLAREGALLQGRPAAAYVFFLTPS